MVTVLEDRDTGLWAAVAVDRRIGGVAAGGIRIKAYSDGDAAKEDAAALALAMTYKAALAGIRCGGAKVVVRGDLLRDRPGALERLGRYVESQQGSLYVGPDFGFTDEDRDAVARATQYVDAPEVADGMARATAMGVRDSLAAALGVAEGEGEKLRGARVGIQGLGKVGGELARLLVGEGAEVVGCDIDVSRVAAAGVREVTEEEIFTSNALDAVAPCALGGAVDVRRAERLGARVLVGAANHLLAPPEEAVAEILRKRDIVHVPDFLANAGAFVLWSALVLDGKDRAGAFESVRRIGRTARMVLARAQAEGRTPLAVARAIADERLADPAPSG